MTEKQLAALRCAYLDLLGAFEAKQRDDIDSHDWDVHWETIKDMETAFAVEIDDIIGYGK
jgi:hypothetical protein